MWLDLPIKTFLKIHITYFFNLFGAEQLELPKYT